MRFLLLRERWREAPEGARAMTPAAHRQMTIQLAGRRQLALASARRRLVVGLMLFVGLFGVLALRLAELTLLSNRPGAASDPFAAKLPPRADIVDRNGVPLARTFDAFALAARPTDVMADKPELARQVAAILPGTGEARVYKALSHQGKYRYIERRVTPAHAQAVNALGDPGLILERQPERLYPNLGLAGHAIGATNIDGRGKSGMERALDDRLVARRGEPVALSLDARVQQALESELGAAMVKHSAIGAAGIILDVHTGELLALASLPTLNPNAPGRATDEARFNRATLGVYELGSTFKTMTIAMGLDLGTIPGLSTRYDATRPLRAGRFTINDDHPQNRWMTVPDVFIHSSNIGTAKIAQAVGAERQAEYMRRLGFLDPVEIEIGERGRTLYPAPANWGEIATMTVGYGHGIAVTPLHLATAYAALVNGGVWRPATLVKVAPGRAAAGRRVFTQATSDTMRTLMRLVVMRGTGRKAEAAGYRIGGKTGTAEKPRDGGYARRALVSTFAGAFPMDNPRYVIVAMLDEPKGTKDTYGFATAGWTTAPVVSRVVSRVAPLLNVAPDAAAEVDISAIEPLLQGGGKR